MLRSCLYLTFSLSLIAQVPAALADAPWPSFRGPQRSGVSSDSGLLKKWPEGGPKLLWEAAGAGRGYASLSIADGKLYTLGDGLSTASDKDEYLSCFDVTNGKQLWTAKTGERWADAKEDWGSSRSTPTIDGDRVYILTPQGALICFGTNGKEIWKKDLKKEYAGKKADSWGYSESVLIDGPLLVCTPGGDQNTMVAMNKQTGETVWSCVRPNDRGAGHASIVISEIGGTKVYVQTTGSGALGVRAKDGKLLWSYEIDKTTAVIPTPIVSGDLVFFTAGYDRGGALLKQVPTNAGQVEVKEVYPLNRELQNKHGGVVLVGEHLYGDQGDKGIIFCAELKTGEIVWKSRGPGSGSASVTAADGHLYVHYANGVMALMKAQPVTLKGDEKVEIQGEFKIPGSGSRPSWSHPVVVDGKLFIREDDKILCYDISA
jgi:outer membrane protein assembly factor BamB